MLAREALRLVIGALPGDWKRRLGTHLGAPHITWSLRQLRALGFAPAHVLDVGAFRGEWTRACLAVFPDARVTCVEPQDAVQPELQRLAAGFPNVNRIPTLLGRRAATGVPFNDVGSGSSVWTAAAGSACKPMTTIDALICTGACLPPQLIKLDAQGYEIEILEGWTAGFDSCEVIQIEMSLLPLVPEGPLLAEAVAYLERRGFVMFDVTELIRSPSDGTVWQVDALFCRSESPLRQHRVWRAPLPGAGSGKAS